MVAVSYTHLDVYKRQILLSSTRKKLTENMNKDVLTVLQEDFNVCKKFIQKVAKTLLNEEVSKYPIFVAVFEDQDIDCLLYTSRCV